VGMRIDQELTEDRVKEALLGKYCTSD